MTIKIQITPGSDAEKAVKVIIEKQRQFREAVQTGKVEEYAKTQDFARPVPNPKP